MGETHWALALPEEHALFLEADSRGLQPGNYQWTWHCVCVCDVYACKRVFMHVCVCNHQTIPVQNLGDGAFTFLPPTSRQEVAKISFLHLPNYRGHSCWDWRSLIFKKTTLGFPGGAVVNKNPPANAGGHGFEPWSRKIQHATEQLSPCTTTTKARAPRAHAPQQEKPPQWEARAPQQRVAPALSN